MDAASNARPRISLASRRRWLAAPLCLFAASLGSGALAQAVPYATAGELGNWYIPPNGHPTGLELDFPGNHTGMPAQISSAEVTNVFAALNGWNGSPFNPITITYDSVANITRVVFSGGALPNAVPGDWPVNAYCEAYHVGLNGGAATGTDDGAFSSAPTVYWLYAHTTRPVPLLMAAWAGKFKKKDDALWAAVYTETVGCQGGGWQFVPYAPVAAGRTVKFTVTNGGDKALKIGVTGYVLGLSPPHDEECLQSRQCAANQAALESLNAQQFPPPGQPGSPFTAVKVSKKKLQPGESFTFGAR